MNTQESADTRIVDPARLPFAYQDALNAGDADAVVALFHQDAMMHTFTGKVLTDREALRAEAVQSIAAQACLTNKPRSTLIAGDTALIIVDWDLEAMLPDGTGISPTGTTTAVARRSADGSWRFAILDCQGADGSPGSDAPYGAVTRCRGHGLREVPRPSPPRPPYPDKARAGGQVPISACISVRVSGP